MNPNVLTPKQKRVLDFIRDFQSKNGYSPSLKEISRYIGKSITTSQHYVEELKKRGFIKKQRDIARGVGVKESTEKIPLYGYVAAGDPIEPIENPELIDVPKSLIAPFGDYYALKIKGDSMVDFDIKEGDTAVFRYQKVANPGDIVVAVTEKGATVKKLRRDDKVTYLQPGNRLYSNINPKELEIRGKFIGVLKN